MSLQSVILSVNTDKIQYIAIAGSVLLFLLILGLIRSKRIKEEYSLLWLLFSLVFLFVSIFRGVLEWFADLVGIAYAPAALFLLLLMAMYMILIHTSMIISKMADRNKLMSQEIAMLKKDVEELKKSEK